MARRVHQVVHMCSIRPLVVVFSIVCVAASVTDSSAQPYVYALVSGGAVEQGGLYQIPLTPWIATVDTATGQVLSSTPLTGCVTPKSFATIPTDGSTID